MVNPEIYERALEVFDQGRSIFTCDCIDFACDISAIDELEEALDFWYALHHEKWWWNHGLHGKPPTNQTQAMQDRRRALIDTIDYLRRENNDS